MITYKRLALNAALFRAETSQVPIARDVQVMAAHIRRLEEAGMALDEYFSPTGLREGIDVAAIWPAYLLGLVGEMRKALQEED